ncbi:MAG: pantoate kinase [Thermoplasmatota archaeon]
MKTRVTTQPPDPQLRRAAAWSPGHTTGLFEIHDRAPEIEKRGSRGAGLCLTLGALTITDLTPADTTHITIYLNDEPNDAPVTRHAAESLLTTARRERTIEHANITIRTRLDLPTSQGFGMSAAGALSTSLALARTLGLGRTEAIRAAHAADITNKSGLGDVAAATHGGFELRRKPGLPPWGHVETLVGYGEIILCTLDGPLETKNILTDRKRRDAINAAGAKQLANFERSPTLENFFHTSYTFADEAGLLTPNMRNAIEDTRGIGHATMSMLGNSIFATGNANQLEERLSKHGDVFRCEIEPNGARLLKIEDPTTRPG